MVFKKTKLIWPSRKGALAPFRWGSCVQDLVARRSRGEDCSTTESVAKKLLIERILMISQKVKISVPDGTGIVIC